MQARNDVVQNACTPVQALAYINTHICKLDYNYLQTLQSFVKVLMTDIAPRFESGELRELAVELGKAHMQRSNGQSSAAGAGQDDKVKYTTEKLSDKHGAHDLTVPTVEPQSSRGS